MIALLIFFALVLAILFLFFSAKTFKGNYFLAGFFLTLFLWGAMIQLVGFSKSEFWAPLLFIHINPLLYLSGPLILFYLKSIQFSQIKFEKYDWLHFVLPVFMFINITPYFFVDFQDKIDMIVSIREHFHLPVMTNMTLILPYRVTEIIRPATLIAYAVYSLIYLISNKKEILSSKSILNIPSANFYFWLKLQLFIIAIYSVLYMVVSFSLTQFLANFTLESIQPLGAFVKLTIVISMVLFFFVPTILYGIPHNDIYKSLNKFKTPEKLNIYDAKFISKIESSVNKAVTDGLILNEDFSVTLLAKTIHVADHHLTYYFNRIVEMKFSDWKNYHRIEIAKRKISEGLLEKYSADQLAKECGFSHLSTFYSVFKKLTSMTPGEFEKSLKN